MKKREVFLDGLRVAATCAVVMLHTITGAMDITNMSEYPLEWKVFLAGLDLLCWCVPVFLMISGYLFLNPAREIGMGNGGQRNPDGASGGELVPHVVFV